MAALESEFRHDCIVVILGHSAYDAETPEYFSMPEGCKIKTFIPANVGIDCFIPHSHVQEMKKPFYDAPLDKKIEFINDSLKLRETPSSVPSEDRAEFCRFSSCTGQISTDEDRYYNKRWTFETDHAEGQGCVVLITFEGKRDVTTLYPVVSKTEGFILTKQRLIRDLTPRYKNILLVDISCSMVVGTDEQVALFKARGFIGGKRKSKTQR